MAKRLPSDNKNDVKIPYESLGKRLKAERIKRKLTIKELSELLGYDGESQVSGIERGVKNPSLSGLHAMCELFSCTPNDLLGPKKTKYSQKVSEPKSDSKDEKIQTMLALIKKLDPSQLEVLIGTASVFVEQNKYDDTTYDIPVHEDDLD